MLTISTDQDSFGTISFASHSVHEVLGYTPKEIRGQNISRLIPGLYAERHEQLIQNYLESDKEIKKLQQKLNLVYPLSSKGHIRLAESTISFMASLQNGIMMLS